MESDASFGYAAARKDSATIRAHCTFPSQRAELIRSVFLKTHLFSETIAYIILIAGETITKLTDLDNLVQFYMTPIPNDALIE